MTACPTKSTNAPAPSPACASTLRVAPSTEVRRVRFALAAVLIGAAGCTPLRVDISEHAAGLTAVAVGDDAESCAEARTRTAEEARYYCKVRGRATTLGRAFTEEQGAGCRIELSFWCTAGGL